MSPTDNEKKEKARIFDLLVYSYGLPGQLLDRDGHPRGLDIVTLRTDLNALDRG